MEETLKLEEKFVLLIDLGIITVPDDYVHETCLQLFEKKNRQKFCEKRGYNYNITDQNFPHPSRILKPGDKLRVYAFKQIVSGRTTSEERMSFLKSQKAVFVGVQGASLVFEQRKEDLRMYYMYDSFDEKENIWEDSDGDHRVPYITACSNGNFVFGLSSFESEWDDFSAFFCFCEIGV